MTADDTLGGLHRLDARLSAQRAAFLKDPYPDPARRKDDLLRLQRAVVARRDAIVRSIDQDFAGRSAHETVLTEILIVTNSIRYGRRRLSGWMRPRRRHVPLLVGMGRAQVLPQPLGVVGIIAPWNAPLQLSLSPLAAAIAAGNRVMLKPSEHAPATANLLRELLSDVFPQDKVAASTDAAVAGTSPRCPSITCSTPARRSRPRDAAAAEHLVPITLELGGKSPVLIAPDADLRQAATDVIFGKLLNAGQTCIAPDYLVRRATSLPGLIDALTAASRRMYPAGAPADYTAIISDRHRERLAALLEGEGMRVVSRSRSSPRITTMQLRRANSRLAWSSIRPASLPSCARKFLTNPGDQTHGDLARPGLHQRGALALYLFSTDRQVIDRVARATCSGALLVNDTMVHAAIDDLPFGGVGASGVGRYHGPEGFETFSQMKPIFRRGWPRLDRIARAPFNNWKMWMFRRLL